MTAPRTCHSEARISYAPTTNRAHEEEALTPPASCHPEHSEGSKTLLSQRYFAYAQYGISALQTLKITASGTIEKTQEELYH